MTRSFLIRKSRLLLVASVALVTLLWIFIQFMGDNFSYSLSVRLVPMLLALSVGLYLFVSYRIMLMESDIHRVELQNQSLERWLGSLNALERNDAITGLPTFVVAKDRLDVAIRRAQRDKRLLAIYRVQVGAVNGAGQRPGGAFAARVIKQKAGRMKRMLRGVDSIIHIGNRDFLLVVEALENMQDVVVVNQKLATALEMPVLQKSGAALTVSDRAALAMYPMDGDNARSLFAVAENHLKENTNVAAHTRALMSQQGVFDWDGGQSWN